MRRSGQAWRWASWPLTWRLMRCSVWAVSAMGAARLEGLADVQSW